MLSIIIINYNSTEFLYDNLKSIKNSYNEIKNCEIIIIDNNSKVKPDKKIIDQYNAQLYLLEQNMGYAKALNYGIKNSKGKFILMLNPDVTLKNDTINELYNYYLSEDIGVLGCKVLNFDGSFQLSSRRRFPFIKNIISLIYNNRYKYNYLKSNIDKTHEVDSVSGCCMYFSKNIYDKVNGFDEKFFLYFEDTDFCLKVKNLGKKVMYYPKTEVFHFKYGSRNFYNYLSIKYQFYRSFIFFLYKHIKLSFK